MARISMVLEGGATVQVKEDLDLVFRGFVGGCGGLGSWESLLRRIGVENVWFQRCAVNWLCVTRYSIGQAKVGFLNTFVLNASQKNSGFECACYIRSRNDYSSPFMLFCVINQGRSQPSAVVRRISYHIVDVFPSWGM